MISSLFGGGDRNRTVKNIKKQRGEKAAQLSATARATLGSGDLRQAVMLPRGEDMNEWLAVNTVDFFNTTNLLYGSITEFCTTTDCPSMTAGPEYEYLWVDPPVIKKPIKCSAPEYVEYVMTHIEKKINDDAIFPSSPDVPFPAKFKDEVKNIFKRLFRIYAHIYHSHLDQIKKLGEEAHLNTAFKHKLLFIFEFDLVKTKELLPLKSIIISLLGSAYEEKFEKRSKKSK